MPLLKPQSEFPTPLFKFSLIFLVGLALGAGLVYWQLNPLIGKTSETDLNYGKDSAAESEASVTATWTEYSSREGQFSLRYNPKWQTMICEDMGSTLYLAPNAKAQAVCASEHGSQISVFSRSGDVRTELALNDDYSERKSEVVTVDGVAGRREQGKLVAESVGPGGDPIGSTLVVYYFYTNGRTYAATYRQTPTGDYTQDLLADFDLMIRETLKFSS